MGFERFIWLTYYFVLKWQDTFNLGLNAVKNTHHIKKCSNKSCSEFNFVQKCLQAHMSTSSPPPNGGAKKLKRLVWLKYYIILKRQNTFNLGLNADKNTDNK